MHRVGRAADFASLMKGLFPVVCMKRFLDFAQFLCRFIGDVSPSLH